MNITIGRWNWETYRFEPMYTNSADLQFAHYGILKYDIKGWENLEWDWCVTIYHLLTSGI